MFFYNLTPDQKEQILNYVLDIYICDGTPSEILAWFKVINIAGKVLSAQELRNTSYTGPWLSDAKQYFSKPNCIAYRMLMSHPTRGGWIEISHMKSWIFFPSSHPTRGGWIEIWQSPPGSVHHPGPTPHGVGGLK